MSKKIIEKNLAKALLNKGAIWRLLFIFLILSTGCGSAPVVSTPMPSPAVPTVTEPPATASAITVTATLPIPTLSPTTTSFPLPTANPIVDFCSKRKPADDDLLVVITNGFGLSADYVPSDLIRLDKYLPYSVVYSQQIRVRLIVVDPLVKMIKAMRALGLKPIIRSAYRSYDDQAASRAKWEEQNPDRAGIISAKPGHSEHQLGLAVDFGSRELAGIVGDPAVEFHTDFDKTSEGKWLAEHAQEYGFTLSYPVNAIVWTGLAYEPWHYRYVGIELATYLYITGEFLTKFLMQARPMLPCVPD